MKTVKFIESFLNFESEAWISVAVWIASALTTLWVFEFIKKQIHNIKDKLK